MSTSSPPNMSKDRVEAFSDGVFAIILTLLVLELHAPTIADHSSLAEYAQAMAPLIPKFISFALTFIMIAIHWVSHHYFFRHIRDVTIGLVWINNFLLLWLCFLPFPTSMFGDHPTDQFPVLLYGVNSLVIALTFLALRRYASVAKLVKPEFVRVMGPRQSIPAVVLFSLSIVLSFVSVYLSLACFALIPVLYFVPTLIQRFNR